MLHNAHRVQCHHSQREGLSVGQSSSSVSEQTGRPVGERTGRPFGPIGQELNVTNAQIRTLLDRQKERILAECQAEIKKHEFQADYDQRSVGKLSEIKESQQEELHFLKLKNFNDEINNFSTNGHRSKIRNYVKLIRKVSMKWKNERSFRVPPSTVLQDED